METKKNLQINDNKNNRLYDVSLYSKNISSPNKNDAYSFSKLSAFHSCPKDWYSTYIEGDVGTNNCFGVYGSYCHEQLENYFKNHKTNEEAIHDFEEHFYDVLPNGVKMTFGESEKDLTESYYKSFINYLNTFDGFKTLSVVGNEIPFTLQLSTFDTNHKETTIWYNGIIDLLATDNDGNYYIIDFKSKSKFKSKAELKKYARQLYSYSLYVYSCYGKFPKELIFEQFRIIKRVSIPFNEEDLFETLMWIFDTVDSINCELDFNKNEDSFFCNNLCNHRYTCE